MKTLHGTLASVLLLVSLNTLADQTVNPAAASATPTPIETSTLLKLSPCKPSGDGTYTEMITTMASVMPPAIGDAFLARYCEECMKKKFSLANMR